MTAPSPRRFVVNDRVRVVLPSGASYWEMDAQQFSDAFDEDPIEDEEWDRAS